MDTYGSTQHSALTMAILLFRFWKFYESASDLISVVEQHIIHDVKFTSYSQNKIWLIIGVSEVGVNSLISRDEYNWYRRSSVSFRAIRTATKKNRYFDSLRWVMCACQTVKLTFSTVLISVWMDCKNLNSVLSSTQIESRPGDWIHTSSLVLFTEIIEQEFKWML